MIEVMVARLDEPTEAVAALAGSLSEEEASRAARLRFERDRRRFIVARARLRQLLAARLSPEAVEFVYGKNGKPALGQRFMDTDWRFNLALRNLFEHPTVAALAEIIDGLTSLAQPKTPSRDAGEREQFVL
jgi:hypothetical protein